MFNKIKGRYSERKINKERTVISYEDMPLEDYEQEKTEISPKAVKKIIIGVVIALLLGLVVFAFANRDKLTWDNLSVWWNYEVLGNAGKGFPVDIVGSEVEAGNIDVNQGRVAYASDTSFVTLNSTGKEINNIQLRYSKPVMKSAENRFLTFGLGEKDYQVQTFDSNLYSGTAENVIFTGDISPSGRYCIVTEGNGFYSELYAFDQNNNRIFKYSFSEFYITSVAINRDGTGCVACGINSQNGTMETGVYVLDFSSDKPVSKFVLSGDYIIDSKYISSGRAILIGEGAAYVIRVGDDNYGTVEYGGMPIQNYCFSPSSGTFALALSKSGDGRSCTLITYNDNGDKIAEIDNPYGAESLSIYKGTVAVLDGNTIYAYDSAGTLRYSSYAGTGAKRIILASDTTAYVLSLNQIRLIDFDHPSSPDSAIQ